jgi:hypothetical protein
MIHYLRKIRRNLLEKNNIAKYLLYAIGEILIVMIGILIALNINNWNENRKISITEIEIIKEMKINLKTDLTDVRWNIDFLNKNKNANQIVLKSLNTPDSYSDTLKSYYANISYSLPMFTNNTSAFENLKSIGFNIIKNDSLRMGITELYSNKYNYLLKLENEYFDNFNTAVLSPQVISNIIPDTLFISAKPINLLELSMNHKFKTAIKMNIDWMNTVMPIYVNIEDEIVTIINQIDSEIKSRTD